MSVQEDRQRDQVGLAAVSRGPEAHDRPEQPIGRLRGERLEPAGARPRLLVGEAALHLDPWGDLRSRRPRLIESQTDPPALHLLGGAEVRRLAEVEAEGRIALAVEGPEHRADVRVAGRVPQAALGVGPLRRLSVVDRRRSAQVHPALLESEQAVRDGRAAVPVQDRHVHLDRDDGRSDREHEGHGAERDAAADHREGDHRQEGPLHDSAHAAPDRNIDTRTRKRHPP